MSFASSTLWLIASLAGGLLGLIALGVYEGQPAGEWSRKVSWPQNASPLALATDQSTVLMFVHPQCPCTVASVEQLVSVLQSHSATATLVCYAPATESGDWLAGPIMQLAADYPQQLKITTDINGRLARQFHVTTSGTCLIYSPNGQLGFAGGVTISRGHRGDNAGLQMIERILLNPQQFIEQTTFPVFGCSLVGTNAEQE